MAEGGGEEKASGGTPAVLITCVSQDAAVANTVWLPPWTRLMLAWIGATRFRREVQLTFRRGITYFVAVVIAAGGAVALAASNEPLEYLDEETGATVTVVGRPLVFVHDRSGSLGPAGDYVTLAAAAVNQSGKITYILVGYFWWQGVPPKAELAPAAIEPLALQADDRNIQLVLRAASAREAGIGVPVHRPRFGSPTPHVYAIDLSTMGLIAESHHLALHIQSEGTSVNYVLLEDRRAALREFVRRSNGID
jgi:hypothetical protein